MLTSAQFHQIVNLCAPHMQTVAARDSCFSLAFGNAPFRNQINWEGATADFVPHLLRTLLNVHRYNGEHPLRTLLVWLKTQCGTDAQAQIDALLPSIDALPEGTTLPDPLTLFISYARDDDEPFVRRLHDDLTACGFNVWYDRVKMPNRGVGFTQEIAHAIEQADRLILVCGPAAYRSEYVRKECEHALIYCKPISPVVRLGDFPPPILEQLSANPLDAIDMRDDAAYANRFAYLLRQVGDQPLPLAPLTNIPLVESWYVERSAPKRHVIQALSGLEHENTVAISAINGLGGVGKSVLAAMVARDCEMRRIFPDGIVRIEVGKKGEPTQMQMRLGELVGLPSEEFKSDVEGNRQKLSTALRGKRMLIILDNVWRKNVVDALKCGADGVKLIVTTRLVNLANVLGHSVRVDLLSPQEGGELILRRAALSEA
ncbi:MAG: NB-ARC domain-containing protein, partial [Aggregatilineales bacterium]